MAQGTATSFAVPNFSGMLFAKGQTATPFSTMIGARPLVTNHVEFTCGQEYNTETGEQPEISAVRPLCYSSAFDSFFSSSVRVL